MPDLTWSRTVISGEELHFDFTAFVDGKSVGRIYRHDGGPQGGSWYWTMNAFGAGFDRRNKMCDGTVATREQAIACVRRAYETCKVGP